MIETGIAPETPAPFDELLGTQFVELTPERVVLELPITPRLHQPYGIVHGGVYATLAETAASYGAAASLGDGQGAVGISNHTDFLHAVRDGRLRAEATPLSRGRTLQLWMVDISDDNGRRVAHARVRLYNLTPPSG